MDVLPLANQLDAEFRTQCARLDRDDPWFGRFELRVDGKARAYKIGPARVTDERIVDWRHPLARAYYESAPGEPYEMEEKGFARFSGVVESVATIVANARTLRRVSLRTTSGEQLAIAAESGFEIAGATTRTPRSVDGLPNVLALLTTAQYRLITASRNNPVIIQGRAGSGKTTVALYRVAWLAYPETETGEPPIDPSKVLIVMFNRALTTFVQSTLAPLKLEGARLDTFHAFALDEIRRAYMGTIEPDTATRDGAEIATAIKKQIGILRALEEFVSEQTKSVEAWLDEKLLPYRSPVWIERFRAMNTPIVRRLVTLRGEALRARDAATGLAAKRLTQVHLVLVTAVRRITQYKEELLKFLTSKDLLQHYLPAVSSADLDTLARYQRAVQSDGASERRAGPKVTFDDFALLLRLLQLKNGGFPDKDNEDEVRIYDHLVIDEAQDFGAVELTVLLAAVRVRTGVTIVGDVNQKIVPEADFIGWDALARELGIAGASVTKLEVAHRSTTAIMAVANSIIGDTTPPGRAGPRPTFTRTDSATAKLERVAELVRAAVIDDRNAHVAVVCRQRTDPPLLVEELRAVLGDLGTPLRLGYNKEFVFGRGVTVTNMRQVKGLEFDVVIALDPTDDSYPVTPQGGRWLYTVTTRAKEQLHFVSDQAPGTLVSAALEAGLVELLERTEVPEVELTAADNEPF